MDRNDVGSRCGYEGCGGSSRGSPFGNAADPGRRGGWRPLARDRSRHRAAARARAANRRARGPSGRAGRSVGAGARGHLLRRAPPRLRVHVERARGGAALRRRHRAQGRVLPGRHGQPGGGACVLPGLRRGRPPPEVRAALVEQAIADAGARAREGFAQMCEVAQRFAGWLELGEGIEAALEYVFARWDGLGFPDVRGDAIPLPMRLLHVARDVSLFLSAVGPGRGDGRHRASIGCRVRASARRSGHAELRRPPRRAGRGADVAAGARGRAVSADLDDGRAGRCRLHGHRDAHRSQVAVAARAPDGRGRARRGRRLADGAAAGFRDAPAARRAGARPRSRGRVECDLGEAGATRIRGVGAGAAPSSLHGARLRPVPGARSDRDAGRLATTNASTAPAITAARAGRRSIRRPASSPPPTATRPCARRGRTGRLSMRRRRRRS